MVRIMLLLIMILKFCFNSVENHLQLKLFKKNEVIVSNDCFFSKILN